MNLLFCVLLAAAVDTGGASPASRIAIYAGSGINQDSLQQAPADPWFGEDKIKHLAFSYLITAGTAGGARLIADKDASVLAGAGAGLIAGLLKEIYDKRTNRSSSLLDLVWDVIGVAAGVAVVQQTR